MTKKRNQKTEELSVSDLEEMLAPRETATGKGDEAEGGTPKPPGPMKRKPSMPPPPVPKEVPKKQLVPVEETFIQTVIDGRYEVVRCLGTGAMGLVFLVRHMRLGKQFALKIINPLLAEQAEFAARFEREADACSRLAHPNCIHVTDFGQDSDGRLFLVMEYAEGTLLNQAIADSPPSVIEALQFAKQILLGLRHAHKEGLVHRDIKMENVVKCAGDDGEPVLKILDFGMAKHPVMDTLTVAGNPDGVVMGTPQYMSPEQIRDEGVDARTDLYAVGVTLFRMISGTPVFKGDSPLDVFAAKTAARAPTLHEVTGREYPEVLESFIAKALERDCADRYASADEMLDALEQVVASVRTEIGDTPVMPLTKTGGWGKKHWYGVVAAALTVVVSGVVGIGLFISASPRVSVSDARTFRETPVAAASTISDSKSAVDTAASAEAVGAAAVASPVIAAGTDTEPSTPMIAKREVEADPVLIEAALLIDQRRCRKAEKMLLKQVTSPSARSEVLLGRTSVCRARFGSALGHYRSALAMDPRYRTDSGMLEDAKRMLSNAGVRADALAFLADDIGKPALPTIIQTAGHHTVREVRHAALEAAERLGVLSHVDLASSYELDLNQTGSCAEKRKIVAKLAELRSKAARGVLVRARDATVRVNIFRSRYVNECIRNDINRALAEMKKEP